MRFRQSVDSAAIAPLMYPGAKHMVTGYEYLLFLVGIRSGAAAAAVPK